MKLTPNEIDIAKYVFQVHYVEVATGRIVNKPLKRAKLLEHFANCARCLIGMEAGAGAQPWARNSRRWECLCAPFRVFCGLISAPSCLYRVRFRLVCLFC